MSDSNKMQQQINLIRAALTQQGISMVNMHARSGKSSAQFQKLYAEFLAARARHLPVDDILQELHSLIETDLM